MGSAALAAAVALAKERRAEFPARDIWSGKIFFLKACLTKTARQATVLDSVCETSEKIYRLVVRIFLCCCLTVFCMYVLVSVCVCVCIYIYIYIYICVCVLSLIHI